MLGRKLFKRLHGAWLMIESVPGQRKAHYRSREDLDNARDKRLRDIVEFAARTVPFYQHHFRVKGLTCKDFSGVGDLKRLPLVDRDMVAENPRRFVSRSRRGRQAVRFETSGTTGVRLPIWLDRKYLLSQAAVGLRERVATAKILGKAYTYKTLYINYGLSTPAHIWKFYQENAFSPIRVDRRLVPISSDLESILQSLDEYKPDVLISYGSYLDLLFRLLKKTNRKVHFPKLVRYGADTMSPAGRDLIENDFGIPVLSNYGAVECLKIGFECGEHSGFHLHEDLCHVDIVNSSGETVAVGEKGEVLISNLTNRGTVLLNYRLGDIGSVSMEPCPCGRTTRLLSALEGRVEDIIALEDGTYVHPRAVWSIFKKEEQVLQYQLTQHAQSRFELRLVTHDSSIYDEIRPRILSGLKSLLGSSAEIKCRFAPVLGRDESGKFRPVRSLFKNEDLLDKGSRNSV